jgi:hypothetical protein
MPTPPSAASCATRAERPHHIRPHQPHGLAHAARPVPPQVRQPHGGDRVADRGGVIHLPAGRQPGGHQPAAAVPVRAAAVDGRADIGRHDGQLHHRGRTLLHRLRGHPTGGARALLQAGCCHHVFCRARPALAR